MPVYPHTSEEAKENGRKGGKKSAEVRKARKTLKEELLLLLSEGNTQSKISVAIIQQALEGNIKAFETIRDTIGEKPKEQVEQKSEIKVVMDSELNEWGK